MNVGAFNGTIADRLTYHNGMKFSTKDKDQDNSSSFNCATKFTGAWWYSSNLNGKNSGNGVSSSGSMIWQKFPNSGSRSLETIKMGSLKTIKMALRKQRT